MAHRSGPMSCPVDHTPLEMSDRQGVEIDYCPTCRGVWLDRGELDKIVERSGAPGGMNTRETYRPHMPVHAPGPRHGDDYYMGQGYPKRRKSFLEELFD